MSVIGGMLRLLRRHVSMVAPRRASMWDYDDDVTVTDDGPEKCPRCSSRIVLVPGGTAVTCVTDARGRESLFPQNANILDQERISMQRCAVSDAMRRYRGGGVRTTVLLEDTYVCVGLIDRGEVLAFLGPEMPKNVVPDEIVERLPCGWSGTAASYGKIWC